MITGLSMWRWSFETKTASRVIDSVRQRLNRIAGVVNGGRGSLEHQWSQDAASRARTRQVAAGTDESVGNAPFEDSHIQVAQAARTKLRARISSTVSITTMGVEEFTRTLSRSRADWVPCS